MTPSRFRAGSLRPRLVESGSIENSTGRLVRMRACRPDHGKTPKPFHRCPNPLWAQPVVFQLWWDCVGLFNKSCQRPSTNRCVSQTACKRGGGGKGDRLLGISGGVTGGVGLLLHRKGRVKVSRCPRVMACFVRGFLLALVSQVLRGTGKSPNESSLARHHWRDLAKCAHQEVWSRQYPLMVLSGMRMRCGRGVRRGHPTLSHGHGSPQPTFVNPSGASAAGRHPA